MTYMKELGKKARSITSTIGFLQTDRKNQVLRQAADILEAGTQEILVANAIDVDKAREKGLKETLVDRLALSEDRIVAMANGLRKVADLQDPVNEVLWMRERPNGLRIGQKRVPMGVIGIIYESRPNVSVDAFGLCFKTGNATILRGGSDAFHSNKAIITLLRKAIEAEGLPADAVQMVEDTDRETVKEMMTLTEFIDLLIPRGGAGLIKTVVEHAKVPVIETGVGNCHIFVDETANLEQAVSIIKNAKTQRPGVCNACESLVLHSSVAAKVLPLINEAIGKEVLLKGDERAKAILPHIEEATEEDWGMEYLDYLLSIKTVDSIDEAIHHINRYNTKHSEAIITENYSHSERFLKEVDAAAVYVNASTRFTDGEMFGFGAEIGISTQKLHARGPMGLEALTSSKYIVYGNGQIR